MIVGIGSDIIKIARIKALLDKNKQRFLLKIFTLKEIELTQNINNTQRLAGYVAKRFAAKEACAKAFGTGIGANLSFHDLEIFQDKLGKPYFKFSEKINNKHQQIKVHLTMTDEQEYAQTFVIIEEL
jgi:holo-[acyl-carrier protein] synthase